MPEAIRGADGDWRLRCKTLRNPARGKSPTRIASILGCSRSQVYRMATRFLESGLSGLVDRCKSNGEAKVNEEHEWSVRIVVAHSPEAYGWQRHAWTQELLVLVAEQNMQIRVSTTAMCRLFAVHLSLSRRFERLAIRLLGGRRLLDVFISDSLSRM